MKKLFVAVLVPLLVALGLVVTTTSPATAACPYTACVNTSTTVSAKSPLANGQKAKVKVTVKAPSSNVPVAGTVDVTVKRAKGGFSVTFSKAYTGKTLKFKTSRLKQAGKYTVTATFTPGSTSVFNPSSSSTTFKVKK